MPDIIDLMQFKCCTKYREFIDEILEFRAYKRTADPDGVERFHHADYVKLVEELLKEEGRRYRLKAPKRVAFGMGGKRKGSGRKPKPKGEVSTPGGQTD